MIKKIIRKFLSILVIFVTAFAICSAFDVDVSNMFLNAEAEENESFKSGYYTYTLSSFDNAIITGYDEGNESEVIIPATLDGHRVVKIEHFGGYNSDIITKIVIPDSVTSIHQQAFSNCPNLTELSLPVSAQIDTYKKEYYPFMNSKNIKKITITKGNGKTANYHGNLNYANYYRYTPWYNSQSTIEEIIFEEGITQIGEYYFYECTGIKNVILPDSIEEIGKYAFAYCTNIRNLHLGNSLKYIRFGAFGWCDNIKYLVIPDSVTCLESYAFNGCNGLQELIFPCTIALPDATVFKHSKNISKITITKGKDGVMPDYDTGLFSGYGRTPWYISRESLKELVLEDGITHIGTSTFSHCTALINITIPETVTSINNEAFAHCTSLVEIYIHEGVANVGNAVFTGCTSLEKITVDSNNPNYCTGDYGALFSKDKTTLIQYPSGNKSEIVSIPASVTSIESQSFSHCLYLKYIYVDKDNPVYSNDEFGVLYDKCYSLLIQYPIANERRSYDIHNNTETIDFHAFCGEKNLSVIILSEKINTITYSAFNGGSFVACYPLSEYYWDYNVDVGYSNGPFNSKQNIVFNHSKHKYNKTIVSELSCTTDQRIEFACDCGDFYVDYIPKTGHLWETEYTIDKEPSCYTSGSKSIHCKNCSSTKNIVSIPSIGTHDIGDWEYQSEGKLVRKCSRCGYVKEERNITFNVGSRMNIINQSSYILTVSVTNYPQNVTFETSDPNIATVNENGEIFGVAIGTATITVRLVGTDLVKYCTVNIVPRVFTIYWHNNNETIEQRVKEGEQITAHIPSAKTGYTFNGWSPKIPDTMPSNNLDFYANWSINKYTVTWTMLEETITQTVEYGALVQPPENTEQPYYIFVGWSAETTGVKVTKDLSFVAEYQPIRYKAEFIANAKTIRTIYYTVETEQIYPPNVPSKTGYTGTWEHYELVPGGITVYAVYTINNYKTTWKVEGNIHHLSNYNYGEQINYPANPQKDGYKFVGWTPAVPQTMPAYDLTFTAVFEELYTCPHCGIEFDKENEYSTHVKEEEKQIAINKASIKIQNNPTSRTIKYGETLKLTATVSNMPEGSKIAWYVDGSKKAEGQTFSVSPSSGTVTVTVRLIDSDGNALINSSGNELSDSQKVSVDSGFFQKIISFFKNLFGMNRTITQAFKEMF